MTDKINDILSQHIAWLNGTGDQADLRGANLAWANLPCADLPCADLRGANLAWANLPCADLSCADLRCADLSCADLRGADLRGANLAWANLRGADLRGANLAEADLRNTCLDPQILKWQRQFVRECPALHTGGRIVYRTARSKYMGNIEYIPGRTYIAPILSFSAETSCHPGIYAGSLEQIRTLYPGERIVRCYVRDGDWVICEKGIRCARLRVLGFVENE